MPEKLPLEIWRYYWKRRAESKDRIFYHDDILWGFYQKLIPKGRGVKVLEIGSAPGKHLVSLNKEFGITPYGVDIAEEGVNINRQIFLENGINPYNVIHADFLNIEFQTQYKECFDVVLSRGLIEDICSSSLDDIAKNHINLMKKRGLLFVTMPNLKGINYLGLTLLAKEVNKEINFDIMSPSKLKRIFSSLNIIFCNYYGVFNCGDRLVNNARIVRMLNRIQHVLDIVFRSIFRGKWGETRFFSPYILLIAEKDR